MRRQQNGSGRQIKQKGFITKTRKNMLSFVKAPTASNFSDTATRFNMVLLRFVLSLLTLSQKVKKRLFVMVFLDKCLVLL
jgi:hypothetical protein